jgi:20S proteasome subunit alpha 7
LGVKCKDGVILGAEKLVVSKLMVPGTNRRLYNVDKEIGCVSLFVYFKAINGKLPDGRHLVNRARSETADYKNYYAIQMPGQVLGKLVYDYFS